MDSSTSQIINFTVDQVSGPKLSLQVLPEMLFAQENQAFLSWCLTDTNFLNSKKEIFITLNELSSFKKNLQSDRSTFFFLNTTS